MSFAVATGLARIVTSTFCVVCPGAKVKRPWVRV
jgi:hypothetical protein